MFYSPMCRISNELLPKFKHLPQVINGCKFCILNINENQGIISMSRQTIAPIEFVPYIIFYVNGRPFLQYDDDPTLEKMISFLQYSMKLVESKKSFIDRGVKVESDIPKYSIARPYADFKCDEAGCHLLTYSEAYKGAKAPAGAPSPNLEQTTSAQYFQRT
jgi:hypothetical protein